MRQALRGWLTQSVPRRPEAAESFEDRLKADRDFQHRLYEAGWNRLGWPRELGGYGGDARHRAVLYDEMSIAGMAVHGPFEHLEILAPALAVRWSADALAPHLQALLRGDSLWCQGFSEVDAGSDLASLRTSAIREGDHYVLEGHKVWTSWGALADYCVALVRTGAASDRHRGLSVFFVDLHGDGVEVTPVRQATGSEEFAEVRFTDARVPIACRIGQEGDGWSIAMDILSCERAAFAWLRQARLLERADGLSRTASSTHAPAIGTLLVDLFAARMLSAQAVEELGAGRFLGVQATPVKVVLTQAEQRLYDVAKEVLGEDLPMGTLHEGAASWQEDYLFSWATSIYGGTRQIQLNSISGSLLGLGRKPAQTVSLTSSTTIDEMTAAAEGVFVRGHAGDRALRLLEWPPQPHLDGAEWLNTTVALFRAQGRQLATTPALGAMGAHVLGCADGGDDLSTLLTERSFIEDGMVRATVPSELAQTRQLLVRMDNGTFGVVPASITSTQKDAQPYDPTAASIVVCPLDEVRKLDLRNVPINERLGEIQWLAQLCLSAEILGACDAVMDLATAYAKERKQFEVGIETFQSIQHLLADAESQRVALEAAVIRHSRVRSVGQSGEQENIDATLLKALAGTTGVRSARAALQVLGATGFTWEHDLHRYARRILTLDALWGSSDRLVTSVGASVLGRQVPRSTTF